MIDTFDSMINAIAIDDEPVALDIIRMHAGKAKLVNLVAVFGTAREGLAFLGKNKVQLVFLDVQMPGINGLEFARLVDPDIQLVFTTAYANYALNGFDLAITDFLLKPISFERFRQTCVLVQKRLEQVAGDSDSWAVLFVKDGHNLVRLHVAALMYIKADDNYVTFVEKDKHTLSRMTMSEVLEKLPLNKFLRVHKSYIVNLDYVVKVESAKILIAKAAIPVSRSMLNELKGKINFLPKKK